MRACVGACVCACFMHVKLYLNCSNFTANYDTSHRSRDIPAFYAYRSACHFLGETIFSHNDGGGLGLSQAIAFTSGSLHFEHNTAVHGGGMKLLNSAEVKGV